MSEKQEHTAKIRVKLQDGNYFDIPVSPSLLTTALHSIMDRMMNEGTGDLFEELKNCTTVAGVELREGFSHLKEVNSPDEIGIAPSSVGTWK
jgi:hypothetical protein